MEMNVWTQGVVGLQGGVEVHSLTNRGTRDLARARWEAQPWRRQLRNPAEYEHPVSRGALVQTLQTEGFTVDAEVARFAGAEEDAGFISIAQVVRFVDSLGRRMALARTDDEVLQLAYLRRNAEDLAERMIDWANAGSL